MRLTDLEIRRAKPGPKQRKLSDGRGLQVWIMPTGSKLWRFAYRFAGQQKLLALGAYPEIGLQRARELREAARALLAAGVDPSVARKTEKAARVAAQANTFDAIAKELLSKKQTEGRSENTLGKVEWVLSFASAVFGARPISEIAAADILGVMRQVEARGRVETANRLRAVVGQVFRLAIATGRAHIDPTQALRGAIAAPVTTHRSAIIEPRAFGALLRAIGGYDGTPETRIALELLALTFVRPGELRAAEWREFDLDAAVWHIPPGRMKMKRAHRVPLAPQAVAALRLLHGFTGHGRYLFPSVRSPERVMSENTLNAALRRLGYDKHQMSSHGFRSAASTLLNECGLWHPDAIERQLAHIEPNAVRRAYARGDFWAERVEMMNWWANRCDELRRGGEVVSFMKSGGGPA